MRMPILTGVVVLATLAPELPVDAPLITVDDDEVTVHFDDEGATTLAEFVGAVAATLEIDLRLPEDDEAAEVSLGFRGPRTIRRDQLWAYFQVVARSRDRWVMVVGHPTAPGRESDGDEPGYFEVVASNEARKRLRVCCSAWGQSPVIAPDELEAFRDDEITLTTAFTLERAEAQSVSDLLRTIPDPALVSARAARRTTSSIVVTGTAPTLYAIREMIDLLDTRKQLTAVRIDLRGTDPRDIVDALDTLTGSTRVVIAPRTRSVIVFGEEAEVARFTAAAAELDDALRRANDG